jgi:MoxR-like ATPase
MSKVSDPARLAAAKGRFAAFFQELRESFAEREDVLAQLALALLSREHVLLAGPPGTAKSALASAVLGRILDEETGRPSLYARQLTESTVQTDVIGPIDFKTLMETGRTSHFTDEGLLGAVHAFLDEVFDGRDKLLRSTLNLLHERELKQGTQIARGRFEIAFMTTNRYVAEVLESARETLLAFVDRIAFVGFVPRGFAEASRLSEVLRREVGGVGHPPLEAPLSVQDLDALQAAAESVIVPEPVCDGLAKLLDLLEGELSAAERADPSFSPTRYLSTRTAVRSGGILRAIVLHDAIFHHPERDLVAGRDDLRMLRLHLLLSGPSVEQAAALLGRERDPREKRQLAILRGEREAFERAFAKLPAIRVPHVSQAERRAAVAAAAGAVPRGAAENAAAAAGAALRGALEHTSIATGAALRGAPEHGSIAIGAAPAGGAELAASIEGPPSWGWAHAVARALASQDPAAIARALRGAMPAARASGMEAALAENLSRRGLAALSRAALSTTLAARAGEHARPAEVAREVRALAEALDEGPGSAQALARWVRGKALVLLSMGASGSLDLGQDGAAAWATERDAPALLDEAESKLRALGDVAEERARIAAAGVEPSLRHQADAVWEAGLDAVAEEVTALCDAALRSAATATLGAAPAPGAAATDLGRLLGDVGATLSRLHELDRRAKALGLRASMRDGVIGPRIVPLLAHTFGRVEAVDRGAYLAEIDVTRRLLEGAGLADAVPVADWLTWAARALLRAEADAARASAEAPAFDLEGYRKLRAGRPRLPGGYLLAQVALRTARDGDALKTARDGDALKTARDGDALKTARDGDALKTARGGDALKTARDGDVLKKEAQELPVAAELLKGLPEELRRGIAAIDRAGIERVVAFLEGFWHSVDDGEEPASAAAAAERVAAIVRSRIFAILLDEGAFSRTLLEAELLGELFPEEAGAAKALVQRAEALVERARRRFFALVRARGESAWSDALRRAEAIAAAGRSA